MSKLEAVSITKSFGDNTILQDVSLRLEPREIVCLLGVSGGGKTTLFNVLSGLTLPDRGQVFLDGREITGKAGHISYMLQKDLLMPYRTVLDNIALPLIIKGAPKKEARRKALEHFAEFGLSGTEKQYPAQLSGGEQQRVSIARALAKNPKILLCDEPTGALDYNTGKTILKLLQDTCRSMGKTVIVITHNQAITAMADRVIHIKSGTVTDMALNPNPTPVERIEW